jgi:hypothetical protein
VAYTYNGTMVSIKKEREAVVWDDVEETGAH